MDYHLTEEDINELIKLQNEEFKEYISREDARDMGNRLLQLYEILIQPSPREDEENTQKDTNSDFHLTALLNSKKVS